MPYGPVVPEKFYECEDGNEEKMIIAPRIKLFFKERDRVYDEKYKYTRIQENADIFADEQKVGKQERLSLLLFHNSVFPLLCGCTALLVFCLRSNLNRRCCGRGIFPEGNI